MSPTLAGFIQFIRAQLGVSTQYLPDNSMDITTAYNLSIAQVNLFFVQLPGGIYALMVYNLAADILINIAQDYSVAINSITWNANVATVITSVANTFISGNTVTIAADVPIKYNGNFQVTVLSSTTFTYPLTSNPGTNVLSGTAGFNLFQSLRAKWGINTFVPGLIQSSSDESTSESLAVPDALKQATISDLQNLKTSYGRWYLSYAQKFGMNWGIS